MIGKLRGLVDAIGESHAIIDVHGVGYEVQCSARALRTMELGHEISLTIETHVREDAIKLYGFISEVERAWFRTLQSVQGVGAKVALNALGTLSTMEIGNAIALQDAGSIERTPGIGKKLAQRIVLELKDKVPGLSMAGLPGGSDGAGIVTAGSPPVGNAAAEAISALTNLGYQPPQASAAVAAAMRELGADADTAKLIRRGLKELAR